MFARRSRRAWRGVRLFVALSSVLIAASPARAIAQDKLLTIDALYDPTSRVDFSGSAPRDLQWIDPTHYLWGKRGAVGRDWMKVDAASGRAEPLFDAAKMEAAVAALGVSSDEAADASHGRLTFNRSFTTGLFTIGDDL